MRHKIRLVAVALVAVAMGYGCGGPTAPTEGRRQLGALQYEGLVSGSLVLDTHSPIRWSIEPGDGVAYAPNVIDAPDTVPSGSAFRVSVYTVARDGCWRAAGMDTARASRVVVFTPWDEDSGVGVCTQILGILRHDVGLTLNEKGEWTLRALGRLVRRGEAPEIPVTAERTIIVR